MGLVSSAVNLLIFVILSFILGEKIKPTTLIYYLVLLVSGAIGGMAGINIKKTEN